MVGAAPSDPCIPAPALVATTGGTTPRIEASEVVSMERSRVRRPLLRLPAASLRRLRPAGQVPR